MCCACPWRMRLSSTFKSRWIAFLVLNWLKVEFRSSPALEEKTEFRFGADALGADVRISFIVDSLSWWCGTDFVICMLDERLRVV